MCHKPPNAGALPGAHRLGRKGQSLGEVDADPGETVAVGILIPVRAFQHWAGQGWATEPGSFTLAAGPSSACLPLAARVELP